MEWHRLGAFGAETRGAHAGALDERAFREVWDALFRLADAAGLLRDPALACARMKHLLAVHGCE